MPSFLSSLPPRTLALAAMALAVTIYGGQFVSVRWGLQQGLSAYDMAALRFIFAGAVMLPFFLRAGVGSCAGLGWRKGLILGITGGVPLTVISNIGLNYAPAAHASAIQPGMVAVTATTLAYLGMRARIPRARPSASPSSCRGSPPSPLPARPACRAP